MRWIVGDVHGMLGPLSTLIEAVGRADPLARWIFTGDYVNRGPESRGVIELLISLPNARFIRGNHDDIFSQIVIGEHSAPNDSKGDRLVAFQWFMQHGLDRTFLSYGAPQQRLSRLLHSPTMDGLRKLADLVPESHRKFIRSLVPVVEEEDLFVTHGYVDPDESAEDPSLEARLAANPSMRYTMLWGRYEPDDLLRPKAWRRMGYFGHTPVDCYGPRHGPVLPIVGRQMVLVDTGAALGKRGRLTAFCPDARVFIQTDHFGKLVERK